MDKKPSAAEQAFEEWWAENWQGTTQPAVFDLAFKEVTQKAYLAAAERTARRCVEICGNQKFDGLHTADIKQDGAKLCAYVIAKEFGLD